MNVLIFKLAFFFVYSERIAQFPADVADPSKLRQISSRLQADRFASLVDEADHLLTSYNSR